MTSAGIISSGATLFAAAFRSPENVGSRGCGRRGSVTPFSLFSPRVHDELFDIASVLFSEWWYGNLCKFSQQYAEYDPTTRSKKKY